MDDIFDDDLKQKMIVAGILDDDFANKINAVNKAEPSIKPQPSDNREESSEKSPSQDNNKSSNDCSKPSPLQSRNKSPLRTTERSPSKQREKSPLRTKERSPLSSKHISPAHHSSSHRRSRSRSPISKHIFRPSQHRSRYESKSKSPMSFRHDDRQRGYNKRGFGQRHYGKSNEMNLMKPLEPNHPSLFDKNRPDSGFIDEDDDEDGSKALSRFFQDKPPNFRFLSAPFIQPEPKNKRQFDKYAHHIPDSPGRTSQARFRNTRLEIEQKLGLNLSGIDNQNISKSDVDLRFNDTDDRFGTCDYNPNTSNVRLGQNRSFFNDNFFNPYAKKQSNVETIDDIDAFLKNVNKPKEESKVDSTEDIDEFIKQAEMRLIGQQSNQLQKESRQRPERKPNRHTRHNKPFSDFKQDSINYQDKPNRLSLVEPHESSNLNPNINPNINPNSPFKKSYFITII